MARCAWIHGRPPRLVPNFRARGEAAFIASHAAHFMHPALPTSTRSVTSLLRFPLLPPPNSRQSNKKHQVYRRYSGVFAQTYPYTRLLSSDPRALVTLILLLSQSQLSSYVSAPSPAYLLLIFRSKFNKFSLCAAGILLWTAKFSSLEPTVTETQVLSHGAQSPLKIQGASQANHSQHQCAVWIGVS
jgi:hypothetical protein